MRGDRQAITFLRRRRRSRTISKQYSLCDGCCGTSRYSRYLCVNLTQRDNLGTQERAWSSSLLSRVRWMILLMCCVEPIACLLPILKRFAVTKYVSGNCRRSTTGTTFFFPCGGIPWDPLRKLKLQWAPLFYETLPFLAICCKIRLREITSCVKQILSLPHVSRSSRVSSPLCFSRNAYQVYTPMCSSTAHSTAVVSLICFTVPKIFGSSFR